MTDIPDFAPGCFGSALAYEETTPVCQVCKFATECRPMHQRNLTALQTALRIPARKTMAPKRIASPNSGGMTLPVKVQGLVDKFDRSDLRITEHFAKGENPFQQSGMNFLKIVGHMLIKAARPLTRQDFSMAFQMKLNWSAGTADSHARMAIQALQHIGAVDLVDGAIAIRK